MFRLSRDKPTIAELLALQTNGNIGFIELRNWLQEIYPEFANVRRNDVDERIEQYANQILDSDDLEEDLDE